LCYYYVNFFFSPRAAAGDRATGALLL